MIEFIVSFFLAALAGDLLYLYYAGAWADSIRLIEVSEVILLYVFVVFGIANGIRCVIKLFRRVR